LEKNNIQIHQAYYGEVDRGHDCIIQTIEDSDLKSYLITYTDRPGALPPGVELIPYYSGSAYSKYYIFAKTFQDTHATRGGMVFTHVLIVNIDDIEFLNTLDDLFSFFATEVPIDRNILSPFTISISDITQKNNNYQPKFIAETIKSLIQGISPILTTGDINQFLTLLQIIWNYPGREFRKRIKFRASFTPNDINGKKDLTIVYIQDDFLSKWFDKQIISTNDTELVEIKANSELLFLGQTEGNPFLAFLIEMDVDLNQFSNFKSLEDLLSISESINTVTNPDVFRSNIRKLSIISPNAKDGKKVKERLLRRLEQLFEQGIDSNIKALRNINWSAFEDGEDKVKQIIIGYLKKEVLNIIDFQSKIISDILQTALYDPTKDWWHKTIKDLLVNYIGERSQAVKTNIWKLINHSDKTLHDIFILIPNDAEIFLIERIPDTIIESTCNSVEKICKERKWFLLHAMLLLKHLDGKQAMQAQLSFEKSLPLVDSIGVKLIGDKLSDQVIIDLAILTGDYKLMALSKTRILIKQFNLENLDVTNPNWLLLWSYTLEETKNISYGIHGNEKVVLYQVLDLIINDTQIPEIIIELALKTELCDISDYHRRQDVWQKLPLVHRELFMYKTAEKLIDQYITGAISISSIEEPLLDVISSDRFMTAFLSRNRSIIEPVIKIYETALELKDRFLSDFITYYHGTLSELQSSRLGTTVYSRNYNLTAKSIYNKSRHNKNYEIAFQKCQNLVEHSLWDSLFKSSNSQSYKETTSNMELHNPNSVTIELPKIVILTAIKEEYLAVRRHLTEIVDADREGTCYELGVFAINEQKIANVIIHECGAKNTNASQETERAIQYFKPESMFFVGIAGSRKPKDFSIGDVIFPEKIYFYEGGKSEISSYKARPEIADVDYSLKELAKKERKKDDWKTLIKGPWDVEKIKADTGIIASGEQIVEHFNSEIGNLLTEHFNDAAVVEMEGFGFAKAASRQGKRKIVIGVVRGISDVIGQSNGQIDNTNVDRRPDNAKAFASDTAAAFAYWLIYKYYCRGTM
jgi:nucleoside phosphorylase